MAKIDKQKAMIMALMDAKKNSEMMDGEPDEKVMLMKGGGKKKRMKGKKGKGRDEPCR